jgi:3-oxoacyl-[acyl-carrier-protein] synthase-3
MLEAIRKMNFLPKEKFYINLEETGNTVSSTIPIALKQLDDERRLKNGQKILLMGFGVGLSWGATIITI